MGRAHIKVQISPGLCGRRTPRGRERERERERGLLFLSSENERCVRRRRRCGFLETAAPSQQGREKMRPSRSFRSRARSSVIPFPLFVLEMEYEYRASSLSLTRAHSHKLTFPSRTKAQFLSRRGESLCDLMRCFTMRGSKSRSRQRRAARSLLTLLTHTARHEARGG